MNEEVAHVRFVVEPAYAGWRLDRYLQAKLGHLSRARVQRLLAGNLVSEKKLKPSSRVAAGLTFFIKRRIDKEPETPAHFDTLHVDDWILVVDKPAGLPVHPTARYHLGTLVGRIREQYGDDFADPVHRLDRETSGVLVCSRHIDARRQLMRAFRLGRVKKSYLAICVGWPESDAFVVDAPLALGGSTVRIAMHVDLSGRPSRTQFAVIKRFIRDHEKFGLLQALPETGRQHQIRVHLRHAGFPIVGDKIYGGDESIYDRFTKQALTAEDWAHLRLSRHALHAERLAFPHPQDGTLVTYCAPLPPDMERFISGGEQ